MKKRRKRYSGKVRRTRSADYKNLHHHYHPKKLYSADENIPTLVLKTLHDAYHHFFMHNCKRPERRECFYGICVHVELCCYHKTDHEYGRRVK